MRNFFFTLSVCLAPLFVHGTHKVFLPFQPNQPVLLNSELVLNISQSLPELTLSTASKQSLVAQVTVNNDSGMPIIQPPFDLTFTLKSIKIDLNANDEKVSFDSNTKESSLYLSQLSKLLENPIQINIGERFSLKNDNHSLQQLTNELPLLKEINPANLLTELFLHLFALGGQELVIGQTYTRTLDKEIPSLPQKIKYKVTAIDDYNVHAAISGKIEKKELHLHGLVEVDENSQTPVDVSLIGVLKGKAAWNRDNAMLYDLNLEYDYSVMCKIGQWEWMMNVTLYLNNKTSLF